MQFKQLYIDVRHIFYFGDNARKQSSSQSLGRSYCNQILHFFLFWKHGFAFHEDFKKQSKLRFDYDKFHKQIIVDKQITVVFGFSELVLLKLENRQSKILSK